MKDHLAVIMFKRYDILPNSVLVAISGQPPDNMVSC